MTRILIVEDKEQNLYYLESLLRGHGFEVDSAKHGAAALVLARQRLPDLVISDLLMPVMDGYTLLRRWRSDAQLSGIPFIVYTATYTDPEDERLALNLGADAFILKPSEPDVFLSRIGEVLERVKTAAAEGGGGIRGEGKPEDPQLFKVYSEALIRKLEEKTFQLEETNCRLEEDIEERKTIERSLRESEERFRQLAENINEVFWMSDPGKSEILYVSPAYEDIWGRSCDSLYQAPREWIEAIHPDDRDIVERAALTGQMDGTYEETYRIIRPDGAIRWIHDKAFPVSDKNGQVCRIVGTAVDITATKQLEQQFLRAQRMESIGMLAGGVAHDLNNLLSPIVMGVDLLSQVADNPQTRPIIDTIRQSARRGSDLVKQILSFARGADGSRVVVQVAALLGEVESIVSNSFPKSIQLQKHLDGGLWPVLGDPTELNQVFLNLCVNARDAMPDGGTLAFSVRNVDVDEGWDAVGGKVKPGQYVVVDIVDSGTGMSEDIVQRIFEPFYSTKPLDQGTGLGLSSVLGIVRGHGGFVSVDSGVGKGTTFRVFLPALADVMYDVDHPSLAFDPDSLPVGKGECILIVDDEVSILSMMRQTLDSFGYRVVFAENGAQAVALYVANRKDVVLVLVDMEMPVMDGPACIAMLQKLDSDVRIVAVSGLGSHDDMGKIEELGIRHFLAKPYTADELLTMLRTVLSE